MIGIKETREFVIMTAKVPALIKGAVEDGVGFDDVGALIGAIQSISTGLDGLEEIDDELADLTESEESELVTLALAESGLNALEEKNVKIAKHITKAALNIAGAVALYSTEDEE